MVEYGKTPAICAYSLLTISAMLAIGTVSPGCPASMPRWPSLSSPGNQGVLYPLRTLLGWLGVALTGLGHLVQHPVRHLQKITSRQLFGLLPISMGARQLSGGAGGKMIDAQSIVVASTATNWFGHEGSILRFVFLHSIALACLVGILVMLQAYVFPWSDRNVH